MSETASGRPERPFEMGDEIIARRQEIARVIVLRKRTELSNLKEKSCQNRKNAIRKRRRL